MPVLRERIETSLPIDEVFDFVADFANSERWDPGVATSERIDAGPLAVGARYRLGIRLAGRVAPMEYAITRLDPPRRVVLAGTGAGVVATDDIAFRTEEGRTIIDYTADIRLTGLRRILTPFAGGAFRRIAENARMGMQQALDKRSAEAHGAGTSSATATTAGIGGAA